jgi:hypothetical protein
MRDIRLGDDIDDFCVRCKRVMNHAVVSVIAAAPAKVRCRTCHSDHDYRHEQAPSAEGGCAQSCAVPGGAQEGQPGRRATAVADAEEVPGVEIETASLRVLGEGEGDGAKATPRAWKIAPGGRSSEP